MTPNEQIISEFIAAWSQLDAEELVSYFSPDSIYHHMPEEPTLLRRV